MLSKHVLCAAHVVSRSSLPPYVKFSLLHTVCAHVEFSMYLCMYLLLPQVFPSTPYDPVVLRKAFEAAVEKRMMSDVPFGECDPARKSVPRCLYNTSARVKYAFNVSILHMV